MVDRTKRIEVLERLVMSLSSRVDELEKTVKEFASRIGKLELKSFGGVRMGAAGKSVLVAIQAENRAKEAEAVKKAQTSTPDTPPSEVSPSDQGTQ